MPERVAIVGNRRGADLAQVVRFMDSLHAKQPDSLVVSGGCSRKVDGREVSVDAFAESVWFRLGGRVRSYRPAPYGDGFGVEIWNYGGSEPAYVLPVEEQRVEFADYKSAAFYRNWQIAEDCDRLVAFYRDKAAQMHSGAAMTVSLARDRKVPVYTFLAAVAA